MMQRAKQHITTTHSESFSTLYATNHKFYGYMDYFMNIPAGTKRSSLIDRYLRLGIVSAKKFKATLDVHHFYLANNNNSDITKYGEAWEMNLISYLTINPPR